MLRSSRRLLSVPQAPFRYGCGRGGAVRRAWFPALAFSGRAAVIAMRLGYLVLPKRYRLKLSETIRPHLPPRRTYAYLASFCAGYFGVYAYTRHETVPVSGRKRFLWLTPNELARIARISREEFQESLVEHNLSELPPDHPKVQRVERIFVRLLAAADGLGLALPQTTSTYAYATPESVKQHIVSKHATSSTSGARVLASSIDQAATSIDQAATSIDQAATCIDQAATSIDQAAARKLLERSESSKSLTFGTNIEVNIEEPSAPNPGRSDPPPTESPPTESPSTESTQTESTPAESTPTESTSTSTSTTVLSKVLAPLRRASKTEDEVDKAEDPTPPFQWNLHVIDSAEFNMFVFPTGDVYTTSGTIAMVQDDDMLAYLLGHEMAHATLMHSAEQLAWEKIALWIESGLFTVLAVYYPEFWNFTTVELLSSVAIPYLFQLPFSREQETEADYVGMVIAARACYNPEVTPIIWDAFEREESKPSISDAEGDGIGGGGTHEFLSTHPSHGNRASELRRRIPEVLAERAQVCERCEVRPPLWKKLLFGSKPTVEYQLKEKHEEKQSIFFRAS